MMSLIVTLAVVGLIVWAIITYIPMPGILRQVIIAITIICVLVYVLRAFGVINSDLPIPQFHGSR